MRSIVLRETTARELGRCHGEAFRAEIAELAEIRLTLLEQRSSIEGRDKLLDLAARHIRVLRDTYPSLAEELSGISEGAFVDEALLVVLNHYTDIRDIGATCGGSDEGCTLIYSHDALDPIVGQTWDMHATAEPFVIVAEMAPPEGIPVTVFTVTGCLGMVGLNAERVSVCINNLTPTDARIGVLWPALVRAMLAERSAEAALQVLLDAPIGSGHNYFIADPKTALNVETSGLEKTVTVRDPDGVFWHTNHYLDAQLKRIEAPLYPTSTTLDRFEQVHALVEGRSELSIDAIKALLGSHEGHPRSVCSHLTGGGDPSASKTCGAVVCDIANGVLYAAPGCVHGAEYTGFRAGT